MKLVRRLTHHVQPQPGQQLAQQKQQLQHEIGLPTPRIAKAILFTLAAVVTICSYFVKPSLQQRQSLNVQDFFTNSTDNQHFNNVESVWVILGAPVTSHGMPGPEMKERLDHCIQLYHEQRRNQNSSLVIVLTGGAPHTYGSSGVAPEALVMAQYLVAHPHGIPRDALLLEQHAQHTFHNALYTKQLLQSSSVSSLYTRSQQPNISIITHDWHMQRSLWCFQIAWSDAPNVVFSVETVQSSPNNNVLQAKLESEQRVLKGGWIPKCIQEEALSFCMPPTSVAMTKWNELSSTIDP
jgi:uncharacterized SAM-binding protein YcdF (DUF218 family)